MRGVILLNAVVVCRGVENALHDSRAALGDAVPCCGYCDPGLPCPPSMRRGASPTTLSWDAFAESGAATIPCGTRVVVDGGDVAAPAGLRVEGELAFADTDATLTAPFVYVCGTFSAGTLEAPRAAKLDVVLTEGATLDADGIDYGSSAFAVFGGLVFLRGAGAAATRAFADRAAVLNGDVPRTTWARLASSAPAGASAVALDGAAGAPPFAKGSAVAASTDWDDAQNEVRTVANTDGATLALDAPLAFPHGGERPFAAEVASLSRNIRVRGYAGCEARKPKPRCGHFVVSHTPHGVVCGVEFTNLGAHTTLGKYPLHAHMCGNASTLAFVANAVHGTHLCRIQIFNSTSIDALFAFNVAHDAQGHVYVFENGLELRNAVVENFGSGARPPDPPWACPGARCAGAGGCSFGVGDTIEACGSRDDGHAEIFWFANPENDVLRNAAVGGHRSAFSVYPVFAGPLVRRPDEQRRAGLDERLVGWLDALGDHGTSYKNGPYKAARRAFLGDTPPHVRAQRGNLFYQNTSALHLEFARPGTFAGNVAHSTRIAFHVYPQWSPASLRNDAAAATWTDLVAYKVSGVAVRAKTRCAGPECFVVDRLTAGFVSMVARARDVESRFSVANLAYVDAGGGAVAAGACGAPALEKAARDPAEYCGRRAPTTGATRRAFHYQRRHCDAPYWAFNFDRASIDAGIAEKCALRGASYDAAQDLKSCYADRGPLTFRNKKSGTRLVGPTSLNATILVDAASAAAVDAYRARHAGGACAHDRLSPGLFTRADPLADWARRFAASA
ncbi:hypothetical protein JL721_2791 [Aureococcus anophagefferens]|nr:hypothetical protein JL721_2791 [Aureococcus anophagefferens]